MNKMIYCYILFTFQLIFTANAYCQVIYSGNNGVLIKGDTSLKSPKHLRIIDGVLNSNNKSEGLYYWSKQIIHDSTIEKIYNVEFIELISTPNTAVEKYIYDAIDSQGFKLFTKIPIIVDGTYIDINKGDYYVNRSKYDAIISNLSISSIASISFLSSKYSKDKYDKNILFGAIDVKTKK